jgi:hypothetical protein
LGWQEYAVYAFDHQVLLVGDSDGYADARSRC